MLGIFFSLLYSCLFCKDTFISVSRNTDCNLGFHYNLYCINVTVSQVAVFEFESLVGSIFVVVFPSRITRASRLFRDCGLLLFVCPLCPRIGRVVVKLFLDHHLLLYGIAGPRACT